MERQVKVTVAGAAVLLVICAAYFVLFGLYVGEATAGEPVTPDRMVYSLYAYGGLAIACIAGMAATVLMRSSVWFRVFVWGAILLCYHFASQLFANLHNLSVLGFYQGMLYAAEFIPSMALVAALIALICQWNAQSKAATKNIAWIGFLCSAFLSGWLIYHRITTRELDDPVVLYDMGMAIMQALVAPLALLLIFLQSRKVFFRG